MAALDDPATAGLDTLGLLGAHGDAVAALDRAVERARALEIPFPPDAVREVAVCGMGGSAIAGDLLAGAYRERLRRPLAVVRDYGLPGWVGEHTLVVPISYSGTTEETLTSTMDAVDRASLVVAISTGGKLGTFYGQQGVPVLEPPPAPMPRAGLVGMLACLAVLLERMGVIAHIDSDLAEARETLAASVRAYGPGSPEAENPAKQLATLLDGAVPIVWGAELTAAVAYRWKCQINENAEIPAFWGVLPEADHNEICAFPGMGRLGRDAHVVMLRDPRNHRQVERRFDLTRELVAPEVRGVTSIEAEGQSPLARMLDLVMLGDYASIYLAFLRDVDPGPIGMIDRLKERLATTGHGRAQGPAA